jgi:ribosomal-protein-alanine N-acetyltransferase
MLELNFTPFPFLSTNRLSLSRITNEDAEEIFFQRSDKRMLRYLDRDPVRSIDEAIQWIKMIDNGINNDEYIAWGITLKHEPKLIGTITFWNIKKEHYRAEIGYALHPDQQGQGIMNEAMSTVLDFGFRNMRLHSVEANVDPANTASIRLLERNNFVREAYHRENYYYGGKFLDSAIYSLLSPL